MGLILPSAFFYPFVVKLDRCAGRCNTLHDLFNKVCFPNKTGKFNLSVFSMITWINESKKLISIYHANENVDLI